MTPRGRTRAAPAARPAATPCLPYPQAHAIPKADRVERRPPAAPGVSAKIVEASEALEMGMKRDSIAHALLARPPVSQLQAQGILPDTVTVQAAAAQEMAERIERGMESCNRRAARAARPCADSMMLIR